jgi:SAM-dependent methyltransferase
VPRRLHHALNLWLWRATALALRGDRVECPCCGRRFRRFLQYPTALCPGCGSYERQRLLCLYLDEQPDVVTPETRVLHVAPEDCIRARLLALRPRRYLSIDLDYPGAMARMDVTRLDLADESFDVILISHVLDAVADERAALREITRVLSAEGTAVVQAPLHLEEDEARLTAEIAAAGLEVGTSPERTDEEIRRFGLLPGEKLLLCRKPASAWSRGEERERAPRPGA